MSVAGLASSHAYSANHEHQATIDTENSSEASRANIRLEGVFITQNNDLEWILKGQVSVSLSTALVAAIERGVTLQFESIFRIQERRFYFYKRLIHEHRRMARLTFHPLTRLFRVSLDGGAPQTFVDLTEALRHCLVIRDWVVAGSDQKLVGYESYVRLRLDTSALPKPLKISALTSQDWNLSTGWIPVNMGPETPKAMKSEGQEPPR